MAAWASGPASGRRGRLGPGVPISPFLHLLACVDPIVGEWSIREADEEQVPGESPYDAFEADLVVEPSLEGTLTYRLVDGGATEDLYTSPIEVTPEGRGAYEVELCDLDVVPCTLDGDTLDCRWSDDAPRWVFHRG